MLTGARKKNELASLVQSVRILRRNRQIHLILSQKELTHYGTELDRPKLLLLPG